MNIAEEFGKNLHRARKQAGVSQEHLAVLATLHRTEIGLLERGERLPRIDTALKLAGALGLPLEKLVEGSSGFPAARTSGRFRWLRGRRGERPRSVSSTREPKGNPSNPR
jgi:transcriptional regulator with XRE-family HTH domain